MKTVVISSLNPAKINAVKEAFTLSFPNQAFHYQGVSVDSEVPDQPMSCQQTKSGALNRIKNAKQAIINADFYVALEAGIEENFTFAWMVIDDNIRQGESRSSSLMLPTAVLTDVAAGDELGDVMDKHFNTDNIKQKGGAIGLLTHNVLTRSSVYQQALILALIPFMHPDRF